MTERLIIGLGGNVGGDAAILDRFAAARAAFTAWGAVRGSPVYRTAPVDGAGGDFLNAALAVAVDPPALLPAALIATVLELERALGRDRRAEARPATAQPEPPYHDAERTVLGALRAPRTIDLDVLVWGAREARYDGLEVPHPRLHLRRFALAPLIDLAGDQLVVRGRSVRAWYDAITDQRVEPTAYRI